MILEFCPQLPGHIPFSCVSVCVCVCVCVCVHACMGVCMCVYIDALNDIP